MAIKQEDFELLQKKYVEVKSDRDNCQTHLAEFQRKMDTEMCLLLDVPIEEIAMLKSSGDSVLSGKLEPGSREERAAAMIVYLGYIAWTEYFNNELNDRLTRYERYLSQAC